MADPAPSASGSGGGKRPRGRPLKGTVDEDEAAVKRRARVRKAQQAFQKRKEAAVHSLEERLNNVQNGLEEFSTAFSNFTTSVTESGIANAHPHVLHQIHGLTERLLRLARIASPQSPSGGEESAQQSSSSMQDRPSLTRTSSGTSIIRPTTSAPGTPGAGLGADHLFPSDLSYFEAPPEQQQHEGPEDPSGGDHMHIWRMEVDDMPRLDLWADGRAFGNSWTSADWFARPGSMESLMASGSFSFNKGLLLNTSRIALDDLQKCDDAYSDAVVRDKFRFCLDSRPRAELMWLVNMSATGRLESARAGDFVNDRLLEDYSRNCEALSESARRKMLELGETVDELVDVFSMESYIQERGGFHFDADVVRMVVSLPPGGFQNTTPADFSVPTGEPAENTDEQSQWLSSARAVSIPLHDIEHDHRSETTRRRSRHDAAQADQEGATMLPVNDGTQPLNSIAWSDSPPNYHPAFVTVSVEALYTALARVSICMGNSIAYRKDLINRAIVMSAIGMST